MFKIRKRKKIRFITIQAEELVVGDQIVYDNASVKITAIARTFESVIVDLEPTHGTRAPEYFKTVVIPRELKIIVPR